MLERMHLAIVREVDRQGSLTAAADTLCLTQSALSHSVRKLEQRLGTQVWQKEGRRLRLTQAGRYLLSLANRVLPQFEHAEQRMVQYAQGVRGSLRIGMECHPCYQWLLKVVSPYLEHWPDVDVDVRQKFQFGGLAALFAHDIDILVTPDPLYKPGLVYQPVFDYEQVLVVNAVHTLARKRFVLPGDLADQTLISYPVDIERLDVYNQFLLPAGVAPRAHKVIETTEIMLQMVAAGRGVAALPKWLVQEQPRSLSLRTVKLGRSGIAKQIFLGLRQVDTDVEYMQAFMSMAAATRA